ncbi:hypothetical protein BH23BAC4_BH23BAC4_15120 [soil metagenome]
MIHSILHSRLRRFTVAAFCLMLLPALLLPQGTANAQHIDVQLVIDQNDMTAGGNIVLLIQARAIDTDPSTLGSGTIDVAYDQTKLGTPTFLFAGNPLTGGNGYQRQLNGAIDDGAVRYARFGFTGAGVGPAAQGQEAGWDLPADYTTIGGWTFPITDADGQADFIIRLGSLSIGVFENQSNDPGTGVINDLYIPGTSTVTNAENVPVPVELVAFEGVWDNDQVRLNWSTASETNNAGFEVMRRSILSAGDFGDWEALSFVNGNGTTDTEQEYAFVDAGVPFTANRVQYRLRQVDTDGTSEYSGEIELDASVPTALRLHPAFPNPIRISATLRFELPSEGAVSITLYDMLGRTVQHLVDRDMEVGRHQVSLDAQGLAAGVYIVRLSTADRAETQRLTIVR